MTEHSTTAHPRTLTEHAFAELVSRETGLTLTAADLPTPFDGLDAWDSMYLITVVTAVEAHTGRPVPVASAMECTTLAELWELTLA